MKIYKSIVPIILFVYLSIYSCAKQEDTPVDDSPIPQPNPTATITIDENSVIKEADKKMQGFNYEWGHWQIRVAMEDGDVLDVSQNCTNVLKSSGVRLPLNRMSGTSSQWMKWKEAIGPLENRTLQGNPSVKQRLGMVEWITLVRSIDPDAEFVIVLNYELETPWDHADLAEFLTGDGSVNINDGENWAKKRIELGVVQPVKVVVWELGNEMDHRAKSIYNTPEPYIEKSKETITAIKGVCPDAKFAAVGATSPWGSQRDWRGWNTAVLQGLGGQIDYLTFHPYYWWLQSDWNKMEDYMDKMKQDILTTTGSDKIKLYISEHGIWPSSNIDDQSTWTRTHDLRGTLSTGAFIGRLYKRRDVAFSTIHAFSAGPWGVIYRDPTVNSRYTTGIAEMTSAFYNAVGEKVVRASLAGKDTVNLETTAMLTDNGLNLVIFNLEPDIKRDLTLKFGKGPYKLKKEVVVTAESLSSVNSPVGKKIKTTEKEFSETGVFSSYTVPEKSMVVLYLQK